MNRRRVCGLGAGALAWACGPVAAAAGAAHELTWVEPGQLDPAPIFALDVIDLDNRPALLAHTAGRAMVVNFWARWCGPCKAEIPELVALHERRLPVDVVGLALEKDPVSVRDFARAYEMSYRVLLARSGALDAMRALGNLKAGLPFSLVLDRRGHVIALRLGQVTKLQLEEAVQRALR